MSHGDEEVLVGQRAWDTEQDAEEVVVAMEARGEARFKSSSSERDDGPVMLTSDEQVVLMSRSSTSTSYVLATTEELAIKVMDDLRE